MLDLYHWEPNTFSLKCLIALHEKELDFASHYVDFTALDQYTLAPYADAEAMNSIEGEAPLLVHDGQVVADSFMINLYLDEAFVQTPLRPADVAGRWRVLVWARQLGEVLAPAVCTLGCQRYLAAALSTDRRSALSEKLPHIRNPERRAAWDALLHGPATAAELDESTRKVRLIIDKVEAAFSSSPHAEWLIGAKYSLADIELFGLSNSLSTLTPDLLNANTTPRFDIWLHRMRERPAVRKALAMSRTGKPEQAFTPGPEHSRWG